MMSFQDFIHKYLLQNGGTTNSKIQQSFSSYAFLDPAVYPRDGAVITVMRMVHLHPTKTHWMAYIGQKF